EHAVAAPSAVAKSSIRCQFSGPFNPRPPDTTISASAIVTFPVAFSVDSTFTAKSASFSVGLKSATDGDEALSDNPYEFFASAITFTSVEISVTLKALFENALRFTWNGDVDTGSPTTFDA